MAESEATSHRSPSSPHLARRCRIPKLTRSSSVRANGQCLVDFQKADHHVLSLTLPSSKSGKDWRLSNHGSLSSMAYHTLDDDHSSVKSFGSFFSYASLASQSQATEASVSSRPSSRKKYVLHCERHMGPTEAYLTPTQRKDKEIRQLKSALMKKTRLCEDREAEIERLKSEIERLHDALSEIGKNGSMQSSQESDRLQDLVDMKNSCSEVSYQSQEIDKSFFKEGLATTPNDDSGISNDLSISPRNSLELEDNDSLTRKTSDKESSTDPTLLDSSSDSLANVPNISEKSPTHTKKDASTQGCLDVVSISAPMLTRELESFLSSYQKDLDQLKLLHNEQYQELKLKFDERVLELQQRLGEANSRYLELRPMFDRAQDKISALEGQLGEVQRDMESQEDWHNQMYLKMYRKGQESARFEQSDDMPDFSARSSKRLSVPDLLGQLQQLESELDETKQLYREAMRGMGDRQAEYTLRFLKDAVFYFLTKKDKEHLKAIQSILGFTDAERVAVAKATKHRRLFCTVFKVKH